MTIDIRDGREYVLLPNAKRFGRNRPNTFDSGVTRVRAIQSGTDSDGDAYVRALDGRDRDYSTVQNGRGDAGYVLPRYLAEVTEATTTNTGPFRVGERVESFQGPLGLTIEGKFLGKTGTVFREQDGRTLRIKYDAGQVASEGSWPDSNGWAQYADNTRRIAAPAASAPWEPKVGDKVRYTGRGGSGSNVSERVGKVGRVTRIPGNAHAHVEWDDGHEFVTSPWIDNLELVTSDAPKTVSVEDAFKVGNTIRFTVTATRLDARLTLGCKSALMAEATESIVKMDKDTKEVTLEAEVTLGSWGTPVISKHGVIIDSGEAAGYFRDIVIVKAAEPARESASVEFTPTELDKVYALLGHVAIGDTLGPLRTKLKAAGAKGDNEYRVTVGGSGIGTVRITKNS